MRMSYKEQIQLRYDKKQVKFNKNGTLTKNEVLKNLSEIYLCPFCLYKGKFGEFLSSNRINIVICPECENNMMIETLVNEMSIEQFARWVFDYALTGFWEKCKYEIFNKRLYKMGLSRRFWDEYKRLKGDEE